ncbi:MAG: cation:dicarboxylase symporter family transporter [Cytophagaceae bacterium]|nr:cation:dicarboxylase symporter family transporter [Cytophagaceae bacterium]
MESVKPHKFYHKLYFYVILAIIGGILLGLFEPVTAQKTKILSDLFIRMIKMVIAPLIFLTVILGIAGLQDLKKAGRIGIKAILYFEIITTLALIIGLVVVNIVKPGEGIDTRTLQLNAEEISKYTGKGSESFIYKIIPTNIISPFVEGEILQVLFLAILTGFALAVLKDSTKSVLEIFEAASKIVFRIVSYIMYFAPLGAFGAMAYTVGQFGTDYLVLL